MFEDVLTWRKLYTTGSRPKRLLNILEEDAYSRVAQEIEQKGNWNFSDSDRVNVLRRIREIYKERPYPQATFEDWHLSSKTTPDKKEAENSDSLDSLDSLDLESDTETKEEINDTDFDDFVKQCVYQEVSEGKLRDLDPNDSTEETGAGPSKKRRKKARINNLAGNSASETSSDGSSDDSSDNSLDSDSSDNSSSEISDSSSDHVVDSESADDISSDSDSSSDDSDTETKKPKLLKLKKTAQGEGEDLDNEELDTETSVNPDIVYARKKLKQWSKDTTDRSWYRSNYTLHKAGFEGCGEAEISSHRSTRHQHVMSLKTILHLKVLEKDWHTAFKTFALLTKIPNVDLRSLWPVGVEILTQLRDEARAKPSNSSYKGRQEQIKIRQFFEWMTLSFPMYGKPRFSTMPNHGPVFRAGSKTYTPIYKVAQLWNLLIEKRYTMLRDNIEEMLLMPPYDQDGAFHYILILCCLSENTDLLSIFEDFDNVEELKESEIGDLADETSLLASRETLKSRIFANNAEIASLMEKCKGFSFEFPRQMVEEQMENIRTRLDNTAADSADENQKKSSQTKEFFGYSFQKGEVIPAKAKNVALPRKYWERLVIETDRGGTKHWVGRFFDYSKQNKAMCLLCGTVLTLRQRKALKAHLEVHDITSENQRSEQIRLKNFDMAEMVQRQKEPISNKRGSYKKKKKKPAISLGLDETNSKQTGMETRPGRGYKRAKLQSIVLSGDSSDDEADTIQPSGSKDSTPIQEPMEDRLEGESVKTENGFEGDSFKIHDENDSVPAPEEVIVIDLELNVEDANEITADEIKTEISGPNPKTRLHRERTTKRKRGASKDLESNSPARKKAGISTTTESGSLDVHHIENDTDKPDSTQTNEKESSGNGVAIEHTPKSPKHEALEAPGNNVLFGRPEYDTSGSFLANQIDDSMDGQRIARSQQTTNKSFEGFSPDTTLENQTFAYDMSRDISRDFHQFASQTQDTQMQSQPTTQPRTSEEPTNHDRHDEFSSDLNHDDSSFNFTRLISDSFLGEDEKKPGSGKEEPVSD